MPYHRQNHQDIVDSKMLYDDGPGIEAQQGKNGRESQADGRVTGST
jgi:hypothetical protein